MHAHAHNDNERARHICLQARAHEQLRQREKREAEVRRNAMRRAAATRGPAAGSEEAARAPPRKPPRKPSKVDFTLEGDEQPLVPHPPLRGDTPPKGVLAGARNSAANMRAEMAVLDFSEMRPDLVKEIAVRSGRSKRDSIFTTYALGAATGPPPAARQAVHIYRTGLDYLLKALTDTWLLPLPTATDPFFLRWWADDTTLSALATNGADQVRPRIGGGRAEIRRRLGRD